MTNRFLFACLLSTATLSGAFAADTNSEVSSKDKKFVAEAASGGMAEVQLGQYAAANADSQEVKDFGQQMATDHTKANDELKSVATAKGIEVSADLASKDQKKVDKLEKLKGSDFDKEYMSAMVSDHEDTIKIFEKESKKGEDNELKALADKTLPTLQHHLEMAKTIEAKVKG